jgi:hypothetical protein
MSRRRIFQLAAATATLILILSACGSKAVTPKAGAVLSGSIEMESAKTAQISLKVSQDSLSIEQVGLSFTELDCQGFSAGSSMTTVSTMVPITDGSFVFKSDDIGEISGKFVSSTRAEGSAHLAFYGGQAECGTWDWSAEAQ